MTPAPDRSEGAARGTPTPAPFETVPAWDPSTLAHRAAHDLLGPLGRIEAFAALLREDPAHAPDGDGARGLEIVSRSAHEVGALVQRLLSLTLTACRPLERRDVDVREAVDAALGGLADDVARTGATVAVDASGTLHADDEMLTLLCAELLANAIAAHREGRRPRVGISLERAVRGEPACLRVTDDGVGLARGERARLLRPFESGARAGADRTGLGLALCRTVCDRHGWTLEVGESGELTEIRIMLG